MEKRSLDDNDDMIQRHYKDVLMRADILAKHHVHRIKAYVLFSSIYKCVHVPLCLVEIT